MNINNLIQKVNQFYKLATSEKLPDNSKDLKTILKNLDELETYQARKKYAEKNLKHLSSGSSRIVYLSNDKTIIKLAKNDKGIAQNKAESNPKMKSKFVNKIISKSKNNIWLETHYLDKITEKQFKKMTDIDFEDFGKVMRYALKNITNNSDKKKPAKFDEISKSEIYKELKRLGTQFKLMPGDLAKISSFGAKDGHPILIDAGLTKDIFEEFYES
ncbi:hypothetical protein UFOVP1290_108 [uncultured Caudovirales phage]|uniref:Uncharacterized protein n=1 Tax=uncultured Caudovirales phage TaxID=2100421 RepID=A0A6J5RSD5_9CAUD|nr:hypothetical protein UFOVP1290_108 [uncultured Caudovirales phage]